MFDRWGSFLQPGACRSCWGEGDWRWRYWGGQISYQRQGEDKEGSLKLNQNKRIIDNYYSKIPEGRAYSKKNIKNKLKMK